jgi:secondary thiamine-phosphate synthase enzyme
VVTVFTPHTTCGLTINENDDPNVANDLLQQFDAMVPWQQEFRAPRAETQAAHMKTTLVGSSCATYVAKGNIQLGMWQGVYLCEFDGPRTATCGCADRRRMARRNPHGAL